MGYKLRPFEISDRDIILNWRNSPTIRKNMYNHEVITMNEHNKWFRHILTNEIETNLMFLIDDVPTGIVSFKNYNFSKRLSYWGFYIGDPKAPKGSGTVLGILGLDYAFDTLKLLTIIGEVLPFNIKSKKFHEKLGFNNEGLIKIANKDSEISVFRYTLLSTHWEKQRRFLSDELVKKGIDINCDYF